MPVNLTELVATTLRNREKFVADNVTAHNGLLRTLEDTGNIKNAGGGRDLTEPLLYNELATKFYDGFETFTIDTSQEVVDAAVYDWKQLGGFSFISGKEKIMNREKWRAVEIAGSRVDALIAGLRNKTGLSLYSLGLADGGKEFGGLRLLVSDNPAAAGTVGAIDQVANPWWRNQFIALGATAFAPDMIQGHMNAMQLRCTRGVDQPNLWIASANPFTAYWESLQAIQRVTNARMADAGFRTLEFLGKSVVYDAQCATDLTNAGAGRMYALNTKYLYFRKAPERWFTTEKARKVENADYDVIPNWTMGNLTTNARFLQGVIVSTGTP
jgi:hypothetical protein